MQRRPTTPDDRSHSVPRAVAQLVALAVILAGCTSVVEPRPVDTRIPIPVAGPGGAKLNFVGVRIGHHASEAVLFERGGGSWIGSDPRCDGRGGEVPLLAATGDTAAGLFLDDWAAELRDRLEPAGYDIVGDDDGYFQPRFEVQEARYSLGAVVNDIAAIVCPQGAVGRFRPLRGTYVTGEASLTVRWEVRDELERRVVFRSITRGYARVADASPLIGARVLRLAFGSAAANLGADPAFWRLVTRDAAPPPRLLAETGRPDAGMLATAPAPRTAPPLQDLAPLTAATAILFAGDGHGSAFLVDRAGYLLTNAHVAGERGEVLVRFVDGPQRIGTVVAADARRDVALIAIDPVDPIAALPIRLDPVRVGEAVAAIGAPQTEWLAGTVSRGTVSAWRRVPFPGLGDQHYIQADTPIVGGNSGGPLVDARGNVVGIAVAGLADPQGGRTHLNLFIPIGDALATLGLSLPHAVSRATADRAPPGGPVR